MNSNEFRSLRESYKACFEELRKNTPAMLYWVKDFILLFTLPILWGVIWTIFRLKEVDKNDMRRV